MRVVAEEVSESVRVCGRGGSGSGDEVERTLPSWGH